MTGIISHDAGKRLVLVSGRAHPELAQAVADELGCELVPTSAYDFANGELYVRFGESVRGSDAFVLQSHTAPINKWIMEQLIMLDALKRASAKQITAIMPCYGYARQDKKHRGREPISARLMADLFKTAGAQRLMAVDLHTSQIQGFFDGPVDHLWALPLLAGYVRTQPVRPLVGQPDPGVPNQIKVHELVGKVVGRTCVIVDDMIDTGGTIVQAADALFDNGAAEVIVASTHALLSGPAVERLQNSRISEVVVTDTLPIPEESRFEKLTVLSIAPLIARAIREVFDEGSVT